MLRWSSSFLLAALLAAGTSAQIIATGAMKRTIWEGQRAGLIAMDTLAVPGIYGMGPLEYMRGEITVVDGRCLVARVVNGGMMVTVEDTVKAPFFVHGRVARWGLIELPGHVQRDDQLEAFLRQLGHSKEGPFFFNLTGKFSAVDLHVWDLPTGVDFSGPQEGGRFKIPFAATELEGQVLGVFSRDHRTIFTHHDSDIHLHVVSSDGRLMGHVDRLTFRTDQVTLHIGWY